MFRCPVDAFFVFHFCSFWGEYRLDVIMSSVFGLRGLLTSQWSTLWSAQPNVQVGTQEEALDDAAAGGGSEDAAGQRSVRGTTSPVLCDSPTRKRPRTSIIESHHAQEPLRTAGELNSVCCESTSCVPKTQRAAALHHTLMSSHSQQCIPAAGSCDHSVRPSLLIRQPTTVVDAVHIMSHMWFRMMRDHQHTTPWYVVTDSGAWASAVQRALHDGASPLHTTDAASALDDMALTLLYGMSKRRSAALPGNSRMSSRSAAAVAQADDDDRWVPALRSMQQHTASAASPPFSRATSVRTPRFDASIDAVRTLMYHFAEARDYYDPSLWLVVLVYADRMHQRAVSSRRTPPWAPSSSALDDPSVFTLYRPHELRVLVGLFGLALKQQSDFYIRLQDTHNVLPRFITSYEAPRSSASAPSHAGLPPSLRAKFPHIARRLEASFAAEGALVCANANQVQPESPPYTVECAARQEIVLLRNGLGYSTLVLPSDVNQILCRYATPQEAAALQLYMSVRIQRSCNE